jgi:hypothetical protein
MALAKYINMSAVSGSVAGTTYSRNAYGSYLRSRAIPSNPNTSLQQDVRGNFSQASSAWRSLTADVRDAWAVFAESYSWSNAIGEVGVLKPNALYCGYHSLMSLTNQAVVADKPDTGAITAPSYSVEVDPSAGFATITWSAATKLFLTGATPAAGMALVYISAGARQSRTSDLKRTIRFSQVQLSVATTGPSSTQINGLTAVEGQVFRTAVILVRNTAAGIARSSVVYVDKIAAAV